MVVRCSECVGVVVGKSVGWKRCECAEWCVVVSCEEGR